MREGGVREGEGGGGREGGREGGSQAYLSWSCAKAGLEVTHESSKSDWLVVLTRLLLVKAGPQSGGNTPEAFIVLIMCLRVARLPRMATTEFTR